MRFIPNVPPKVFTISAEVIGYLLIDDTTANEQNALGNWLMLVAQILCTNAFYAQVQQERGNPNIGARSVNNSNTASQNPNDDTIRMLTKMVNAMNKEIENIKKDLNNNI